MEPTIEQPNKEVQELKEWKKSLERSATIPLDIDQAFRERFLSGKMIFQVATVNFASQVAGNSTSVDVVVPGAKVGDPCLISPGSLQATAHIFQAYCLTDGLVTVKFDNQTAGAVDLPSALVVLVVFSRFKT